MLVSVEWMTKNYNKYNALCFGGKLPTIELKVGRAKYRFGYAEYKYVGYNSVKPIAITISNFYDSPEADKLNTLLHEMIHILDYTLNPQRFAKCARVKYDAHGTWFMNEAKRLREYGFNVNTKVTTEESNRAHKAEHTKWLEQNKINDALVVTINGTNGNNFMLKTSRGNINVCLNKIKELDWHMVLGNIKDINVYTFNDITLAKRRSVRENIRGWFYTSAVLLKRLEKINATEIHSYDGVTRRVVRNAA